MSEEGFVFKKGVRVGMRTEVLDDLLTGHAKEIGALNLSEKFHVHEVEIEDDLTMIYGEIQERQVN